MRTAAHAPTQAITSHSYPVGATIEKKPRTGGNRTPPTVAEMTLAKSTHFHSDRGREVITSSQMAPSMRDRIAAVDSRAWGGPSTMPKATSAAVARMTPVGIASERVRFRNPGT